jgi:glutamyl endopeptidase
MLKEFGVAGALICAMVALPLTIPASAQYADSHTAVASDGKPIADIASEASGGLAMRGYRGDGVPLKPGQMNDARASIRTASKPADPEIARGIIGQNGLVRVRPTTNYPTRAIAYIYFYAPVTRQYLECSGFMVSKNLVATRGECVYHRVRDEGAWSREVRVAVGRDGGQYRYGECRGTRLFSVRGWTVHGDEKYDYGAIKLDCDIGLTTGVFGLAEQPADLLIDRKFYVGGYPGRVIPLETYAPIGSQWQGYGRIVKTTSRLLQFNADTIAAMGGGPVWNNFDGCTDIACAVAITGSTRRRELNAGVRILRPIFNNYYNWAGDGGGPIP